MRRLHPIDHPFDPTIELKMKSISGRILRPALIASISALALLGVSGKSAGAQGLTYSRGQSVSPAYEGWRTNPDGSFTLLFGYINRNWEEELDVPIGPSNGFSPGPVDRGQPTHFLPRRNRFAFEVTVPADFGDRELLWTVRSNGEEKVAIGSLRPDYFIDNVVIMSETGALGAGSSNPELRANEPPRVTLETPAVMEVQVGQPARLIASVSDDGQPEARSGRLPVTEAGLLDYRRAAQPPGRITVSKVNGLYLTWFVYRAPDPVAGQEPVQEAVAFEPGQVHYWEDTRPFSNSPYAPGWIPPAVQPDGRWVTVVTFDRPGTYVLRGRADDGGLFSDQDVTIHVRALLP
jgi:hypothetical protein